MYHKEKSEIYDIYNNFQHTQKEIDKMIRVMLVDDEPLALRMLKAKLKDIPTIQVVAETTEGSQVLKLIKDFEPNLIFLDINLGHYSGLDVAEQINLLYPHVKVVFVTAYSDYAVQAFELNAIDYLMKPVTTARVTKTISRVTPYINQNNASNPSSEEQETSQETIYVQAFGQAQWCLLDRTPIQARTKKVEELFFLLWHNENQATTRDFIIASLWPNLDEEKASALMHSTFYQLRKTLSQLGYKNPISLRNKIYHLNVSTKSDYDEWLSIVNDANFSEQKVARALELYQGDYFAGQAYEWAYIDRESIRAKWLHYLLDILKQNLISEPLLDQLLLHVEHIDILSEEWIIAIFEHFGEHKQLHHLTHWYDRAQNQWNDELGLDLPTQVTELYSRYLLSL